MGSYAEFDVSELDEFTQDLLRMAEEVDNGRHTKQMLRNTGNKLKRRVVRHAKQSVKYDPKNNWTFYHKGGDVTTYTPTGNLFKGLKRGKVYFYKPTQAYAVRVYGGSPAFHTNLLDTGHEIVLPSGERRGRFQGYKFFESAIKSYEPDFYRDIDNFIDKMLRDYL